jgi:hypothetical protein
MTALASRRSFNGRQNKIVAYPLGRSASLQKLSSLRTRPRSIFQMGSTFIPWALVCSTSTSNSPRLAFQRLLRTTRPTTPLPQPSANLTTVYIIHLYSIPKSTRLKFNLTPTTTCPRLQAVPLFYRPTSLLQKPRRHPSHTTHTLLLNGGPTTTRSTSSPQASMPWTP